MGQPAPARHPARARPPEGREDRLAYGVLCTIRPRNLPGIMITPGFREEGRTMSSVDQTVRVYQDLANLYVQQGQAQMRDRFLVLAADAMHAAGRNDEAERLRGKLLQVNPHHLFKPFRSVAEAL